LEIISGFVDNASMKIANILTVMANFCISASWK
jgi:hypothetical protein